MSPKIPNIGYRLFTKFENPICDENMLNIHIILLYFIYFSFVFDMFFKKLYSAEMAVVIIALIIIAPYRFLYIFPKLPAAYTAGNSILLMSLFIVSSNKNMLPERIIIIIKHVNAIFRISFFSFIYSFIGINSDISVIVL